MPFHFGSFELSPESYELKLTGATVHVEPRVFELLVYLVRHRDRVVPKQELFEQLWPNQFVSESALTGAVRDARRALGDAGSNRRWIQTVHRRGFRFSGEVEERPGAAPAPAGATTIVPAIAVLPLESLSRDPDQDILADGLTEALITELAKIAGLRVVSRTSAMVFKGVRKPLPEIGRALGVESLVEGTVQRHGERVKITVQLLRSATDEHLWAESFDRDLGDVLALQSEVAVAVARRVGAHLSPQDQLRPARRGRVEPAVYLAVLHGQHHWNRRTEEGFRRGLRSFQHALDLEPAYAPALVGIADCWNMLANYGLVAPGETHLPARAAARRALELDPDSGEAHRALALIRWIFEFDWLGAEGEYRLALALEPSSAVIRWWFGVCLAVQGRFDESLAELEVARASDPLSLNLVAITGWVHYFARRHREALPYYSQVLHLDPDHLLGNWYMGQAQIELGNFDAGVEHLERASRIAAGAARFLGYLGNALARGGREREARGLLAELESRTSRQYVPAYFPALIHCGLGESERALSELERAWCERDTMLRDLKVDPPWEPLHREARYLALLGNLGLGLPAKKLRE